MDSPAPPGAAPPEGGLVSPEGLVSPPPGIHHDPPETVVLGEPTFHQVPLESSVEVFSGPPVRGSLGRSLLLGSVRLREDGRFHWEPEIPLGKAISVRAGTREEVLRAVSRRWKRWMDFFLLGIKPGESPEGADRDDHE